MGIEVVDLCRKGKGGTRCTCQTSVKRQLNLTRRRACRHCFNREVTRNAGRFQNCCCCTNTHSIKKKIGASFTHVMGDVRFFNKRRDTIYGSKLMIRGCHSIS